MSIRLSAYNRPCTTALVLAASLAFSSAQAPVPPPGPQGQSIKGAVLKGKAPVSKEILKVQLPKPQEVTLQNGLRLIVLENHRVPTFSIQMVFMSGGLADPADHRGLASFTASLLREGTRKLSSREIAEQIESLGAAISAGAGLSSLTTTVGASGLTENLDAILDIFSQVILEPAFPQDEVEKFKNRTLAQLQFQRSLPQFLAQERFSGSIYRNHPAGLVTPPIESIQKTTPEDLARFHGRHYQPNNAMLAVVGDVTLRELLPKVQQAFGAWRSSDLSPAEVPQAPEPTVTQIHLIDRPGSVQTVLLLGNLAIERTDPDYFPLLVMDKIVGGGPAARLFLNLREDKSYTYGAYSSFSSSKFRGVWLASSEVRTEVTEGAMREFLSEFKRIREEPVPAQELADAKRSLVGNFALSLEEPQSLLGNIVTQKIYNLAPDYWDTYPQKVAAVSAEDVQRAAQKYVNLEHLQMVAVGDASKVRDVLAQFGALELYDAEGKQMPPGR
ncbi:MAG: insulinase family protein [Acidobacteria bacterium]|nr:insulinase family protein [Acidobacteriota bacterium]